MSTPLVLPSQNSTTVRPWGIRVPPLLRGSFQLAARVMPGAAAAWAQRLLFTPIRRRVRQEETEALAQGQAFELDLDGRPLRGWSWGSGPAVLLVHGWGGHSGQWMHVGRALAGANFRAIAVDMPGHGMSHGSTSSLIDFNRAMQRVANLFGPLHGVVAHSFGCAAATYAFSSGLSAQRAVFVAPPLEFQNFWDRFREGLGIAPGIWDQVVRSSEASLQVSFAEITPEVLAPRLAVPLRILHDTGDPEVPHADGARLAGLWPGAELISTSALGHYRILRDPATIAHAVDFVTRDPPRG